MDIVAGMDRQTLTRQTLEREKSRSLVVWRVEGQPAGKVNTSQDWELEQARTDVQVKYLTR